MATTGLRSIVIYKTAMVATLQLRRSTTRERVIQRERTQWCLWWFIEEADGVALGGCRRRRPRCRLPPYGSCVAKVRQTLGRCVGEDLEGDGWELDDAVFDDGNTVGAELDLASALARTNAKMAEAFTWGMVHHAAGVASCRFRGFYFLFFCFVRFDR